MKERLTISEVAHQLGINPQTIYFYERIGLIPSPHRSEAGYRLFSEEDLARLSLIISLKNLDMTLEEIKLILNLKDDHCLTCQEVSQELHEKISKINTKIEQLTTLRTELINLLDACCTRLKSQSKSCECTLLDEFSQDKRCREISQS